MHMLSSTESPDSLTEFLKPFPIADLGQGDPVVGCNLLTAMAVTLADLAPDDGSVHDAKNLPVRLGPACWSPDPRAPATWRTRCSPKCSRRQNNLNAHLIRYRQMEDAGREQESLDASAGAQTQRC